MEINCRHREMLVTAFLALFLISRTEGQLVFGMQCPPVTPATGLTAGSLTNTWFLQRKYYSVTEEKPLKCEKLIIGSPKPLTNELSLLSTGKILGVTVTLDGEARPTTPFSTYSVTYYGKPFFPTNFIVIGSGTGYLVLFSCTSYGNLFHIQQVLILTTAQNPTQATLDAAFADVMTNGIPPWLFTTVSQQNC